MRYIYAALTLCTVALATPAAATPGALNGAGCHGAHGRMGYHCHDRGSFRTFSNGRHYIAGHFGHGRRHGRRHHRR